MNSMQLKILGDEQARVAALRAGAIDGATLSVDVARSLRNQSGLRVLSGPNAAFRELQMTIKRGEDKPWHRQARPPGGHARDQPRGHHQAGLQRRGRVLGLRSARLRPLAADRTRS